MKRRKVKKTICKIHGCNKKVLALGICSACYHRMRYWDQKTMRQKMKRLDNLNVYHNSLVAQTGNVVEINTGKRRKTG